MPDRVRGVSLSGQRLFHGHRDPTRVGKRFGFAFLLAPLLRIAVFRWDAHREARRSHSTPRAWRTFDPPYWIRATRFARPFPPLPRAQRDADRTRSARNGGIRISTSKASEIGSNWKHRVPYRSPETYRFDEIAATSCALNRANPLVSSASTSCASVRPRPCPPRRAASRAPPSGHCTLRTLASLLPALME